ncbi:tellurite resistance TerB family protein [Rhizobium sp. L1K21]|uniref:tellurite resistance TerB family protein n=1 Tax=Rhizobium sp. L1K21 TaxID=2954933 RepID=UPI002092C932|nr:tellurite resistance TerB family protein [Rhizobium sp. L1K21]MCO6187183.1 tellurite resistance TerB family protein [Rhizobium sp. L1K21]
MAKQTTIEEALIYVMIMTSASDRAMSDAELARIGRLTRFLPVFEDFDDEKLIEVSRDCTTLINGPEGLDILLEVIKDTLPERLYDTAYALAVEIAAADQVLRAEELRVLQLLRDRLGLDRLITTAIERAAIARFRKA